MKWLHEHKLENLCILILREKSKSKEKGNESWTSASTKHSCSSVDQDIVTILLYVTKTYISHFKKKWNNTETQTHKNTLMSQLNRINFKYFLALALIFKKLFLYKTENNRHLQTKG